MLWLGGALLALAIGAIWLTARAAPARHIRIASSPVDAAAARSTSPGKPGRPPAADPQLLKTQGNEHLGARRYAEALVAYDAAALLSAKETKLAADLAFNRSMALEGMGRLNEALAALDEERRLNAAAGRSEDPESTVQRARLLMQLGQPSDAVELLRACTPLLQNDEDKAHALEVTGYALFELDQANEAMAFYDQALSLRQSAGLSPDMDACWNRSTALYAVGRYGEAVAGFAEAETVRRHAGAPLEWEFEWDRGLALSALAYECYEAAEQQESRAAEVDADAGVPVDDLWQGFDYLNYSEAALEAYDNAIRLCRSAGVPLTYRLLAQRAWCLCELSNWQEALEAYIAADQLHLEEQASPDPHLALGSARCYRQLGDNEEALAACAVAEQRFLTVGEPVEPYLYWLRARCYWDLGAVRESHAAVRRAVELYAAEGEVPADLLDFAQELAEALPNAEPDVPTALPPNPSGSA